MITFQGGRNRYARYGNAMCVELKLAKNNQLGEVPSNTRFFFNNWEKKTSKQVGRSLASPDFSLREAKGPLFYRRI